MTLKTLFCSKVMNVPEYVWDFDTVVDTRTKLPALGAEVQSQQGIFFQRHVLTSNPSMCRRTRVSNSVAPCGEVPIQLKSNALQIVTQQIARATCSSNTGTE